MPRSPIATTAIQTSYSIKETKKVSPSMKVSALRKALLLRESDMTSAALFIRSSLNNQVVGGGSALLRVHCDPQLPGR
jgi:hypothetical protein